MTTIILYKKINMKKINMKNLGIIILIILGLYFWGSYEGSSTLNPNLNENDSSILFPPKSQNYISLSNGMILFKNPSYLKGLGELEIKNGTNLDAVAKLVGIDIDKSILTLYIKAKSSYTMNKISKGNYKLFFSLGNDWDSETKTFLVNPNYEKFEEIFDFTIREYEGNNYINTEYSTFEVTLNPVIGGDAETQNVNSTEFANY